MAKLRTFVLVYEDKVISPMLTTVREYANWMEGTFDETICQMHLYLNSKKANGQIVSEWHPGTRIGYFFDKHEFNKPESHSWFIPVEYKAMKQLVQHNFAVVKDRSSTSQNLRLYTVDQIQLYVTNEIDKDFKVEALEPQQLVLSKADMNELEKPAQSTKKRKLF